MKFIQGINRNQTNLFLVSLEKAFDPDNELRLIERTEHASYIEKNRKTVKGKEHLYKRRQAIAEHPCGVIKRQWGVFFITTKKGINRASADVGLMFTACNFRRLISVIGLGRLKQWLEEIFGRFFRKIWFFVQSGIMEYIETTISKKSLSLFCFCSCPFCLHISCL